MQLNLQNISYTTDDFSLSIENLEIKDGEFFTLLGPSGCGKSTTLRLIAGLVGNIKGEILLNNNPVGHLPPEKRNIGMVFQDLALFPNYSVEGNIEYGLKTQHTPSPSRNKRINELLNIISLEHHRKRRIHTLSGGEQQRVAIARSLAPRPGLLLLDEPLSALDTHMRVSLRREIKRLHRELGFTCIYVTHDQEEALSLSDRIGIMANGRIVQTGTPEDLIQQPKTIETAQFLGFSNCIQNVKDNCCGYVRPASCRIQDNIENKENHLTIQGVIEYAEYTGAGYLCGIHTEHGTLQGIAQNKYRTGDSCVILIPKDRIVFFDK